MFVNVLEQIIQSAFSNYLLITARQWAAVSNHVLGCTLSYINFDLSTRSQFYLNISVCMFYDYASEQYGT
jgi:hypothetical protein